MNNSDGSQPKETTDAWVDSTGNHGVDPDTARRIREHLEAQPAQTPTPPGLPDNEARAAEIRTDGINTARKALEAATDRINETS